jgi:hypothetical protein
VLTNRPFFIKALYGVVLGAQYHLVEDIYNAVLLLSTQHHPVEDLYIAGLLVSTQHHPVEDLYKAYISEHPAPPRAGPI